MRAGMARFYVCHWEGEWVLAWWLPTSLWSRRRVRCWKYRESLRRPSSEIWGEQSNLKIGTWGAASYNWLAESRMLWVGSWWISSPCCGTFSAVFWSLGLGVDKGDACVHPGLESCQMKAMKWQRSRALGPSQGCYQSEVQCHLSWISGKNTQFIDRGKAEGSVLWRLKSEQLCREEMRTEGVFPALVIWEGNWFGYDCANGWLKTSGGGGHWRPRGWVSYKPSIWTVKSPRMMAGCEGNALAKPSVSEVGWRCPPF